MMVRVRVRGLGFNDTFRARFMFPVTDRFE